MSLLYNSQAQSVVILLRVLLSILAPWYPAQKHGEANMRGRGTVRRSLSERFGEEAHAVSNVLIKSAWGSDDPTKAAFAFLHANAFAEAGHPVQIFLLGEAVGCCAHLSRMRSCRSAGRRCATSSRAPSSSASASMSEGPARGPVGSLQPISPGRAQCSRRPKHWRASSCGRIRC